MTHLILAVYLTLILHPAYGCLPATKQDYCNIIRSDPHQVERIVPALRITGLRYNISDMTEFCNSDFVGDGHNGLCEDIQVLTTLMATSLAANLTSTLTLWSIWHPMQGAILTRGQVLWGSKGSCSSLI